jgi:hypothetical protein
LKELKILYLYPDILDLYGDIGNIKVLKYRLKQRGINAVIDNYSINDVKPDFKSYDIIFAGGGADNEQQILSEDLIKYKSMANVTALDRTRLCNVPMFKSDIEKGDDLTFDKVVTGIEVEEGEWSKLEEFTDNFHISNYCDNISFVKPLTAYYSDGKLSELEEGDCFITCVDEDEDTNTHHTDLYVDKTFTLFHDNETPIKVYVCTTYDGRCKLINCDIVLYKKFEKSAFKKVIKKVPKSLLRYSSANSHLLFGF